MPGSATAEVIFIAAMMILILIISFAAVFFFFKTYKREMSKKALDEQRSNIQAPQTKTDAASKNT